MKCPSCGRQIIRLRFLTANYEHPQAHVGGKPPECKFGADDIVLDWLIRNNVTPLNKKTYNQLAYLSATGKPS